MKAVVAAFNQEKALVGAFSVIANLRMQFGCNFLKHYHQAAASSDKTLKYDSKNFSFRLKNRDSVVISESRGRWSWRHACCNSLYLGLAVTILVFVIMLLSTSPHNYRSVLRELKVRGAI